MHISKKKDVYNHTIPKLETITLCIIIPNGNFTIIFVIFAWVLPENIYWIFPGPLYFTFFC